MIKSRHNKIVYTIFMWLTHLIFKRNFNSLTIQGAFEDNGQSVLVIANHISWWDGPWAIILNSRVLRRKFSFMMLEETLKQFWYLNYLGGFSIKKKRRGLVESINYANELLNDPANMVLMFPQGVIHSLYNDSFEFEQGVERVIQKAPHDTQVLLVANLIDYFSNLKPNLVMTYKKMLVKDFEGTTVENEYNRFYAQTLQNQKIKTK